MVPLVREWTKRERLEAERESLGLYLTAHPFDDYARHWRELNYSSIADVLSALPAEGAPYLRKAATLAGVVMDIRRRGNRLAIILDDNAERIEVTLFDEVYAAARHLINKHAVLVVENTGTSLNPQLVATLAEPFQRGTERIRNDHDGVGLGLAIVKSIARAHDGTLTLAPREGGGLVVTVVLPSGG